MQSGYRKKAVLIPETERSLNFIINPPTGQAPGYVTA